MRERFKHCDETIRLADKDADAQNGLAIALQKQAKLKDALKAARKAVAIEPNNKEYKQTLDSILALSFSWPTFPLRGPLPPVDGRS
jgi:Flp pilus assembly protein TadD